MTLHISYAVILVTLIVSQILRRRNDMQNRLFLLVLIFMTLSCTGNLVYVHAGRNDFMVLRMYADLFTFLCECAIYPVLFAFLLHDHDAQLPFESEYRKAALGAALISAAFFLLYAISMAAGVQLTHIVFGVRDIRLSHFLVLLCRIAQYALLAFFTFTHKGTNMARRKIILLLCIIMTAAAFFDIVTARYDISHLLALCAALLIYLNFQQEAEKRKESMELELINTRLSLILGKIRPEFVFNTLEKIEKLCLEDCEKAQSAISLLSDFLRGNIDKIDTNDMIPFTDELEHINSYIELVRLCGTEVILHYDLSYLAFRVPRRCVFPVVEQFVNDMECEERTVESITITGRKEDDSAIVEVFGPCRTLHHDMNIAKEQYETISFRLSRLNGATFRLYCDMQKQLHAVLLFPPERKGTAV